ncbi:hypothetical protein BO71DRAFT_489317 [Aspergillus ellipticus CBS 707.79]|uniref:Heterokaryon incompatibility domain-containing protein n=1 Tax=Aspergillus ellipticus CBS 707.79 TaxID=1448320 RepID=A0A319E9J6_9EURO|nr:hypothetical protein BO71DRAFT_489317 [Aspergillus ellipticus CBS 707.79]
MWTYQEYPLARNHPVCICGDTEFEIGAYAKSILDILIARAGPDSKSLGRVKKLPQMFSKLRRHTADKLADLDRRSTELENTAWRKCKDLRDRIYALYGFSSILRDLFPVDYNKSLNQVMYETAKFLIMVEGVGLKMLAWFSVREDRFADDSIPSWVPDFTTVSAFDVSPKDFEAQQKTLLDPKPTVFYSNGRSPDSATPVRQIIDAFAKIPDIQSIWNHVWEPEDVPYRILLACLNYSGADCSAVRVSRVYIRNISRTLLKPRRKGADAISGKRVAEIQHLLGDALPELARKTVFVLDNGTAGCAGFGIGENEIEDGDQALTDVHHLGYPLVVRPDPSRGDSGRTYYRIVGLAYVDGRRFSCADSGHIWWAIGGGFFEGTMTVWRIQMLIATQSTQEFGGSGLNCTSTANVMRRLSFPPDRS